MIDTSIILTGGVGLITTVLSSIVTYVLAKRKYDSEVDLNIMERMERSLKFYEEIVNNNKIQLEELMSKNKALENEMGELRKQVSELMLLTCKDLTCQLRKRNNNG